MHVFHIVLHTFPEGADKENLFNNQEINLRAPYT